MEGRKTKTGESHLVSQGRPAALGPDGFHVRHLNPATSTTPLRQLPPKTLSLSPEERIKELREEIHQLNRDLTYCTNVTNDVLFTLMPKIRFHVEGLCRMVQKYSAEIEQARSWQRPERDESVD